MTFLVAQLTFLAVWIPLAGVLSVSLLVKYCARHGAVPVGVGIVVGLVWFMSMLVPVLLPLDVAEMTTERCRAEASGGKDVNCAPTRADPAFLALAWHVGYWFCFSMSWLVLPILSSYVLAGAFSVKKRFFFALRDRLIFFLVIGVLFGIATVLLVLRFQFSLQGLSGILVSLANVFGVFVSTLMLSYGLIEVPKWLWKFGDYQAKLRSSEIRATYTMERMEEAKSSMALALGNINAVMSLYDKSKKDMPTRKRKTIKKFIRLIQAEVPNPDSGLTLPKAIQDNALHCALTEDYLAGLRFKVKKRVIEFRKVNYLWKKRCVEAFELEDLIQWRTGDFQASSWIDSVFLTIRAYILPVFSRIAAAATALLTMATIWSEATLWTISLRNSLDLSPFSYLIHQLHPPYIVVILFCFACVLYLYTCLFFGIFRFRLFMLYELVPKHTDPFTLVLNSILCSRLLIPVAYNFITIMHETTYSISILYEGATTAMAMTRIATLHKGMDEVPVFGVSFNLYFPAVIVLFVLLTLCRVWDKIMNLFDLTKYSFEGVGDERLEAFGRQLLSQERNKWMNQRHVEEDARIKRYMNPGRPSEEDPTSDTDFGGGQNLNFSFEVTSDAEREEEIHQSIEVQHGMDSPSLRSRQNEPTELEAFGEQAPPEGTQDIAEAPRKSRKKQKMKTKKKTSKNSENEFEF